MKNSHSDTEIVNHLIKIIGNGTFQVETINESVLIKMLELRGTPILIEKTFRNIDKDYKLWLKDIN